MPSQDAVPAYAGIPVHPVGSLLRDRIEILPAVTVALYNPLAWSNTADFDPAFFRRLLWRNAARDDTLQAVTIGRYGAAIVNGQGPFLLVSDQGIALEHIPENLSEQQRQDCLANLLAMQPGAIDVRDECVFVCTPNLLTWGHWLVEILPRALIAERIWPNRFRFVLPTQIADAANPTFFTQQIVASLAAYHIHPDRLILLDGHAIYRFSNLHDFTGMPGGDVPCHPGLLHILRDIPGLPPLQRRPGITSVLRGANDRRAIRNREQIVSVLSLRGAGLLDPLQAPFASQVAAIRSSEIIVGDMGSNLTTAIFAGPGSGFVTLAPNRWDDGHLPRLLQDLDIFHADIRGFSRGDTHQAIAAMPYHLPPHDLEDGLDRITALVRDPPRDNMVACAGYQIARRMGQIVFDIAFGTEGNAQRYMIEGFAGAEPGMTWSTGPQSCLLLKGVALPEEDLWLDLDGVGYASPPLLPQTLLLIAVNGETCGRFAVAELTRLQLLLPREWLARRQDVELRFAHPICPPVDSVSDAADARCLGFCFRAIRFRRVVAA